jgi:hypothetical protein
MNSLEWTCLYCNFSKFIDEIKLWFAQGTLTTRERKFVWNSDLKRLVLDYIYYMYCFRPFQHSGRGFESHRCIDVRVRLSCIVFV